MESFITKSEVSRIWNYMQRFPLYDDMRELNNKFLPELAKMEQVLEDYKLEMDKMKEIIR